MSINCQKTAWAHFICQGSASGHRLSELNNVHSNSKYRNRKIWKTNDSIGRHTKQCNSLIIWSIYSLMEYKIEHKRFKRPFLRTLLLMLRHFPLFKKQMEKS